MTERQKMVLDFVNTYIRIRGYPPSYQEIAKGLNMTSKSNIHRLVHTLKEQGLIKLKPHVVRSMEVIDKSVDKMVSL